MQAPIGIDRHAVEIPQQLFPSPVGVHDAAVAMHDDDRHPQPVQNGTQGAAFHRLEAGVLPKHEGTLHVRRGQTHEFIRLLARAGSAMRIVDREKRVPPAVVGENDARARGELALRLEPIVPELAAEHVGKRNDVFGMVQQAGRHERRAREPRVQRYEMLCVVGDRRRVVSGCVDPDLRRMSIIVHVKRDAGTGQFGAQRAAHGVPVAEPERAVVDRLDELLTCPFTPNHRCPTNLR